MMKNNYILLAQKFYTMLLLNSSIVASVGLGLALLNDLLGLMFDTVALAKSWPIFLYSSRLLRSYCSCDTGKVYLTGVISARELLNERAGEMSVVLVIPR